jgi:uncharacterized membrane protein YhhN
MYNVYSRSLDSKLCLAAMGFSFLGDVALNCTPHGKRPHYLLYLGAIFFMLAHTTYADAYWLLMAQDDLGNPGAFAAFVFMVLLFIMTVLIAIHTKQSPSKGMIVVFSIYTFIIGMNFITICSYSYAFHAFSFVGALSFLISDFIIGVENIFKIKSNTLRKLVWIFYPIGQILIIACR